MDEQKIARINALYHKSKQEGLTDEECAEQMALRGEYIAAIRANMRATLDRVEIAEPDGTVTELKRVAEENEKKRSQYGN